MLRTDAVKRIVVFDLDHTITRKDTYLRFAATVLSRRPNRWFYAAFLPLSLIPFKLGRRDNQWLKERFLKTTAGGMGRSDLEKICSKLVESILRKDVRPKALLAIKQHRRNGDYLLLASASFEFYVSEIAKALGFDDVVCTRAETSEAGLLTGRIDGLNCYGQEKLRQVVKATSWAGTEERIVYTDHHADLPLLKWADKMRVVNPTGQLISQLQGLSYEVCDW